MCADRLHPDLTQNVSLSCHQCVWTECILIFPPVCADRMRPYLPTGVCRQNASLSPHRCVQSECVPSPHRLCADRMRLIFWMNCSFSMRHSIFIPPPQSLPPPSPKAFLFVAATEILLLFMLCTSFLCATPFELCFLTVKKVRNMKSWLSFS